MDGGALLIPALAAVVLGGIYASEVIAQPHYQDNRVHVTYWEKWTGFEFDAMKAVVDEFNRSQDRIYVDILGVSAIDNKTMVAVAGGIPPDIAGLYGANVAQYADNHAIQPLDDFCRVAGIRREQYVTPFWDQLVYNGHIYGLVSTPASVALHYNTDLFRQFGLDPNKPPKTMEELVVYADKMTRKGKKGLDITGFMPSEPGWWNWAWACFFGGRWWDGKDKITANAPENVKAMEWVQSFSKKYGPGALQTFRSGLGAFSSPQNGFLDNKVAMELQGVWMYNFISQYNKKLKWAVAPWPYPQDRPDLKDSTIIDLDFLAIPSGAKHPKEAFEFIKFVESQKGMELLCLGQRKNSPLRKVSPGFYEKHPNPYIKLFTDLCYSKNAFATPKIGIWKEYVDEINSATDEIILMKKTPKEALDYVTARMQPKLDEYLERLRMRGER